MASKGGPVSEEEEAAICEALEAGMSTRQAAKKFNRAKSTIIDVARRNGLDLGDRSVTKNAAIAKSCYASEARIKLVGEGLDKARHLLPEIDTPRDLKDWFLGVAIGIDKRRLEDEDLGGDKGGEITKLFDSMEGRT